MAKVELELREEVLQSARRSAQASHATLEQWMANAIERSAAPPNLDVFFGLFADAPDLIDTVMEDMFRARENHPLRQGHG